MSENVVEVENLSKVFKDFWGRAKVSALSDVSFNIEKGRVFALLGPNGSGKTTFIKLLLGLLFPSMGKVNVFGESIFKTLNKSRIGFLPENSYFYDHLTGYETLNFYARLLSLPKKIRKQRVEDLLELTQMKQDAHRPLGDYSQGMLRRIGIAQALLADPEFLIFDEPTNGLDPLAMDDVHRLVLSLKSKGKTILICTHLLAETEEICDDIGMLYQGKLLEHGSVSDLYQKYDAKNLKALFLKLLDLHQNKPIQEEKPKGSDIDQAYLDSLS